MGNILMYKTYRIRDVETRSDEVYEVDRFTVITCEPTQTNSTASIRLQPTVAAAVTVDWGDGSSDRFNTTNAETKTHTYTGVSTSSKFTIKISCNDGTYSFPTYICGTQANNQASTFTDVKLSSKVTSLGNSCFSYCYSLQSVTIPNGVTSLGDSCFNTCTSLKSVTIPNTVTSLGNSCFQGCYSLQSVTIPNSVTSLGSSCFYNCKSLQSVTIPNSVTSLGNSCFYNCLSLQSVTIPNGITSLVHSCFYICRSLQSVTIPNGVTSLGTSCFNICSSLQVITIPETVQSIGNNCFVSTPSLRKVYCKPTTPPAIGTTIFSNTSQFVLYVPSESLNDYLTDTNWGNFSASTIGYNFN